MLPGKTTILYKNTCALSHLYIHFSQSDTLIGNKQAFARDYFCYLLCNFYLCVRKIIV